MTAPPAPLPDPTQASRQSSSLGGVIDLLLFLLLAVVLFLVVQYAGLSLVIYRLHQARPELDFAALAQRANDQVQYNAFFLVPVQVVYYALLFLLLYLFVRRRELPFAPALAIRPLLGGQLGPILLLGGILALIIQMANLLFPPPGPLPIERLFTDRAAALLILGAAVLVAPVIEELVFRGYVFTLLEQVWGLLPAILISGLLFGLIHFPQLERGYFQMASLCVVGIAFSLIRARTGSTTAAIWAHLAYNATISALYLISPQFRQLPT